MILTIDIGNTATKLAALDRSNIVQHWRIPTPELSIDKLHEILEQCTPTGAVFCSVVPVATTLCANVLMQVGLKPLKVDSTTPLPISNKYATPETLGADRLANAMGAFALCGAPCIIVSAGTAITIDVLDRDAAYLGGAIWAGTELVAEALAAGTAALPMLAPSDGSVLPIGRTTTDALRAGIHLGAAGGVDHIVRLQMAELDYPAKVICTGGGGELLTPLCPIIEQYVPDLTLIGLKAIYDYNAAVKR